MNAVARLKALLGLDTKEFKAGVRDAKSQAGGLSSSLKMVGGLIAGAFSVGALVNFGKSVAQTASQISDMADNLNLSTKDVAGLSVAAAKAGVPFDKLSYHFGKITSAQMDVANGSNEAAAKFAKFGISVDDVLRSDPVQLFEMIAIGAGNSSTAVSDLGDIFGEKLGTKTLNLLKEISTNGIPSISEETDKAIKKVDDFGDAWSEWSQQFKLVVMENGIGILEKFGNKVSGLVPQLDVEVKPRADQAAWDEFAKSGATGFNQTAGRQPIDIAAVTGMSELEIIAANRRADESKKAEQAAKKEQMQANIERMREQARGWGNDKLDAKSIRTDSMREMGGLVGRDISMMPVFERNARAAEMSAATLQRVEALQRELVALGQSQEWSR